MDKVHRTETFVHEFRNGAVLTSEECEGAFGDQQSNSGGRNLILLDDDWRL